MYSFPYYVKVLKSLNGKCNGTDVVCVETPDDEGFYSNPSNVAFSEPCSSYDEANQHIFSSDDYAIFDNAFISVGTVDLSEEQLAELTIIFNYFVPVCATCGKLLAWEEFVEAYANDSSFMECDSCYCAYADIAINM